MRKSKGQTVELLYTSKKETNKKSKNVGASIAHPKKNKKKTKKTQNNNNEIINLDNEIIIGLTPKKKTPKKEKKLNKAKKSTTNNIKTTVARSQSNKKPNKRKEINKSKQNPKKKRRNKIIKWIVLSLLLLTAIILFMMSSVFNIKQIVVINNNKVSSQEIINLSGLTIGVNMFKTTNGAIKNGIKTNPYIEDITIKRNINGTVTLNIKERQATYMLKFANAYIYINNQGYILEISENPLEVPIITGFSTPSEEIKAGNRLNTDDLKKLDDVVKIIETSKNTPLANIITEIDISNSADYKITLENKQKIIRMGEMTNINIKLQMAGKIFEDEKEKTGEIYFQYDGKRAIFKEEVSR